MIEIAITSVNSLEELSETLDNLFGVTTRITNKTISFKLEDGKQAVRGNRLGDAYAKDALEDRIVGLSRIRKENAAKLKAEKERIAIATKLAQEQKQEAERKQWDRLSELLGEVNQGLQKRGESLEALNDHVDAALGNRTQNTTNVSDEVEPEIHSEVSLFDNQETVVETEVEEIEETEVKKTSKESDVVHYDSYISGDYAETAVEAELDAEAELKEIAKPKEWKEEFSDYLKANPGIDVDEVIDGFGAYYDKLWDEYNSRSRQTIDREIKVKSR